MASLGTHVRDEIHGEVVVVEPPVRDDGEGVEP